MTFVLGEAESEDALTESSGGVHEVTERNARGKPSDSRLGLQRARFFIFFFHHHWQLFHSAFEFSARFSRLPFGREPKQKAAAEVGLETPRKRMEEERRRPR